MFRRRTQSSPLDIVFDGQCGFCRRALALLKRFDTDGVLRLNDATDATTVASRFPMLAAVDTQDAMSVVTAEGTVFRGFFAFRRLMWASTWLWPLLVLFYAPGAASVGPRVYSWVARNRHRLGCDSAPCTVPVDDHSTDRA